MTDARKIVFFCSEERREEFLAPYVAGLIVNGEWQIAWESARDQATIEQWIQSADMLWFDSMDDRLVEASQRLKPANARIVCRVGSAEAFARNLENCHWEFIDHLVATSEQTFEILSSRFDRLSSYCTAHLLPVVIDPGPDDLLGKPQTNKIIYSGRISFDLNSQLLLQVAAALESRTLDYKLIVAGRFDNLSTQAYFENLLLSLDLGDRISFEPPPQNPREWYRDKSYILGTSTHPGQEAEVFRAMATGVRPLVHNFYGATTTYDSSCLFDSVDHFCDMLSDSNLESDWRPEEYRGRIVEQHNIRKHLSQFISLCRGPEAASLPRVSIVLPTYNRAHLLKRVLSDLGKQEYPDLEIVVSDDCSADDTEKVVRERQQRQKNIVYLRNERNLGPCHNAANAASRATGDYLLVCSDDDLLDRQAVRRYVDLALRKRADLVYSDLGILDGTGKQNTIWHFRNYYANVELLRDLIFSGCNRIPEVFLCRRELFESIYVETYGRRFLNTYFMPALRQIRMAHLPEPLYKYTVHQQSTFNTVRGLYDRVKSTQNYINTALFMYSPIKVFRVDENLPFTQQIAQAYYSAAAVLAKLGSSFVEGEFYTGVRFKREDGLYMAYLYTAFHWLEMAKSYGLPPREYEQLHHAIFTAGDPLDFDAVNTLNVPEIYRRLPWFAFRPFNTASSFVALDVCTLGAPDWLHTKECELYSDETISISLANHVADSIDRFAEIMSRNPVTVVNLFDRRFIKPVVSYLVENHLFSVQLLNFSELRIPKMDVLRNVHNLTPDSTNDVTEYLDMLTRITAVKRESTSVPAGA